MQKRIEKHVDRTKGRLDRQYGRAMRWDECHARLPDGPCRMAEIGVWTGGTCFRLLSARPELTMLLVDPWESGQANPEGSYANSGSTNALKPQAFYDKVYRDCMQRLAPFMGRFTVSRCTSLEAAKRHLEKFTWFDLVFIDGDHSYEGVSTDIRLWTPAVKPGGWIGGHDFGRKKHFFPGVERAVREAFGEDFELGGDSTWWHKVKA